jgi:hypothetical protein
MMGVRTIIFALMAVLWSSIPAHARGVSARSCPDGHICTSSHFHSAPDSENDSGPDQAFSHTAKPWNRRLLLPSNPDDQTGLVPQDKSSLSGWENLFSGGGFGFTAVLAQSWQFELRTALEPRAPSFLA